jgi:predicted  nucleic acid-binding Zn ribbon protein
MLVAELEFKIIADTSFAKAEQGIRHYLEKLIFQGQILGREFPTYQAKDSFFSRVVLPQSDALDKKSHSSAGIKALEQLQLVGLSYPKLAILGDDLMSNHTDPCPSHAAFILFCSFSATNSVLYCAEHFAPVPLYKVGRTSGEDFESLVRWQLQYQALDEIQMQEKRVLFKSAEQSVQGFYSALNQQGYQQAKTLSKELKKPVYYYLYSGSSHDCALDTGKKCPSCGSDWKLAESWHGLFDFCCEPCQLLSNIAFDCQS